MSEIVAEFGGSVPAPLSQYYRGGALVPNGLAANSNIPTSGLIKFSDFYGATSSTAIVPVASFTRGPISGPPALTVNFADTSTNTPTSWAWNFGDGATSTQQHPTHAYTSVGTYTVTLVATNAAGSSAMYTQLNSITVYAFQAAFSVSQTTGVAPVNIVFTNTTLGDVSNSWDFGDWMSQPSTVTNPNYTYNGAGTFTITLTSTNNMGTVSTVSHTVTVTLNPLAPVANYNWVPTQGALPVTVTFNNTTTNTPTSFYWQFDDGAISYAASPTHVYNSIGLYKVKLTAYNAAGSSSIGGFISITQ
jgi:PKD repeat protein